MFYDLKLYHDTTDFARFFLIRLTGKMQIREMINSIPGFCSV